MEIIVNGKRAIIKSGSTFDYNAENRLFFGRDGYTLSITFPLMDCPQNREIFGFIERLDKAKETTVFECSIIDRHVSLYGSLSIVKVSSREVQGQFAVGKCMQTVSDPFEDTFINDLDLGSYPTVASSGLSPLSAWEKNRDEVALPWINTSYPTAPNNWVDYSAGIYSWDKEVTALSWMPYLIVIAKRICEAIGYTYSFEEWENSVFRYVLICNVLPASWGMTQYSSVLPRWTVSEFFQKLELFMACEFDFDHKDRSVKMRFSENVVRETATDTIENLVDKYSVDITNSQSGSCEYIATKRLAYKDVSHELSNFYSCDWFKPDPYFFKSYDTLEQLIELNKLRVRDLGLVSRYAYGDYLPWGDGSSFLITLFSDTKSALLYAKDVDMYFCFRRIGTMPDPGNPKREIDKFVLQPVNVFGSGSVEDDNTSTEEIEFVPPCIIDTYVSVTDDRGFMLSMKPNRDFNDETISSWEAGYTTKLIEAGDSGSSSPFYDEIFVAYWDGTIPELGRTPYPFIDSVIPTQEWGIVRSPFNIRLNKSSSLYRLLPQIIPTQKFKFSWLSSSIPNPRAIFNIRGRRYLCEKITATFTEAGMSQLLKGEFYPILED